MDFIFLCLTIISISNSDPKHKLDEKGLQNACLNSKLIVEYSDKYNIDRFILSSIIWHESRWVTDVISTAGACGLTQVIPYYAKMKCKDLFEPENAISAASKILSDYVITYNSKKKKSELEKKYDDISYALSCYAVGPKCLESDFARKHLRRVVKLSEKYKNEYKKFDIYFDK